MPKYEKIRNRRLFQRKEPENRLWKFLNSSIVIWCLTVIVGSFVTFTYTNLQACLKDADEKATRANRVFAEVLDRRVEILHAINKATNMPDLAKRLKGISYTRHEFRDVSMQSLLADLKDNQTITRKLPFAEEMGRMQLEAAQITEDDLPYIEVLGGRTVDDLPESFLPKLKAVTPKLATWVSGELSFVGNWSIVPYCTVSDAVASLWQSRERILEFKLFIPPREAPFVALPPGQKSEK